MIDDLKSRLSHGGAAVLQIMLLVAVLALANLAAVQTQFAWDMSEGRRHTLDETTVRVLGGLKRPVKIVLFAGQRGTRAEELIEKLVRAGAGLSWEFVDVTDDRGAQRAAAYAVPDKQFIIVERDGARRWVPRPTEQRLLAAVLQVAKGGDKKVLFTMGHGESDLAGQARDGLAKARAMLRQAGYRTVQAEISEEALAEAKAVVISSPRRDLADCEREQLHRFVAEGGGLLAMVDPPPAAGLGELLSAYGVTPLDERVVELDPRLRPEGLGTGAVLVRQPSPGHPVSERMSRSVLLQEVRSLGVRQEAAEAGEVLPVCVSSAGSGGQATMPNGEVRWRGGARILMAATGPGASPAGKGRVAVIGSSSFATNRFFQTYGNSELWEAAVHWLAGDLDQPLLAPKEPHKSFGFTGPRDSRLRTVQVVCVLIIPAVTAVMGLVVFIRRAG